MAAIIKPTRPASGDPVQHLWRHVERLCAIVSAQQVEISALKNRLGLRGPMDNNVVYVRCCKSDGTECWLPVLTAGMPNHTKHANAEDATVDETNTTLEQFYHLG